jgi:hypothetical protein
MAKQGYIDYRAAGYVKGSAAGSPIIYDAAGNIIGMFEYASATLSKLYGQSATTDDFSIFANQTDSYAYLTLLGNGGCDIGVKATNEFRLFDDTTRYLTVYLGAGNETFIEGTNVAGGDIRVVSNSSDGTSYIRCNGASNFVLAAPDGSGVDIYSGANKIFDFDYSGTDARITTAGTNFNVALIPNGSGLVKFGTYGAITTETNQGFITILDAAGNSRKLCVVA